METTLSVFNAFLMPIAALRLLDKQSGSGTLARFPAVGFLGMVTRPEFALNAAALFVLVAWRRPELRRLLATTVFLYSVLRGLALTGWRLATYGDFVPDTVDVKRRLPGFWGGGNVLR